MSYIRSSEQPNLRKPVLILAFAGWNDASEVATTAVRFLVDRWKAPRFADVDPEEFYNFARIRPHVRIEEDGKRTITWPENAFYYHVDPLLDRDFVLLVGIEPNLKWRTFCEQIVAVCQGVEVTSALSLGGLVADVPHTMATQITAFSTDPDLVARYPELGIRRSRYEGPTGIVGVLSDAFTRASVPVGSMWGNVPHYISASPNPKVVHALLSRLSTYFGLGLDLSEMERSGRRFERQVNEALTHNPEVAQYVKQLEVKYEQAAQAAETEPPPVSPGELPKAEEVVRQLEEFLRQHQSESKDDDEDDEPSRN